MELVLFAIINIAAWERGKFLGHALAKKIRPVYEYKVKTPEEFVEVLIQMQKDLQKEVEKNK